LRTRPLIGEGARVLGRNFYTRAERFGGMPHPARVVEEAAGEGDVVPDTESGEGGPAEPAADAEG